MARIFLSYTREDGSNITNKLGDRLSKLGYEVFQDVYGIRASENWEKSLEENIQKTDFIIIVVTQGVASSEWVYKEFTKAQILQKTAIVLRVNEAPIPPYLQNLQAVEVAFIDENNNNLDTALLKMVIDVLKHRFHLRLESHTVLYPDFFNHYNVSHEFADYHQIRYLGAVGLHFLKNSPQLAEAIRSNNAKVKIILAQPTEHNIATLNSWSADDDLDLEKKKLIREMRASRNLLDLLYANPDTLEAIELRLLDYLAPVSLLFRDQGDKKQLILGIYHIGPSVLAKAYRPSTIITSELFPDLYAHFDRNYQAAWERAKPSSFEEYVELIENLK